MQTTETFSTDPISIESDGESTTKSETDCEPAPVRQQGMFIWNQQYQKWHECLVEYSPPSLQIKEYEDQKLEVNKIQLAHLTENWYHGSLTRREARVVLQDFNGGNGSFLVRTSSSFEGKFAVSFVHESNVKHVVIESSQDQVAGTIYQITPNGPVFNSVYELVQEAQKRPLIQNHLFSVQLTCSPPKPNTSWLHRGVKSLSQAEQVLRKEHRDGAFFVYKTQSEYAPYIVAYRSNGSILHNLIVYTNQSNGGYTLNNVTSQVLYKVIHYFMENPINGKTVLRFPVPDRSSTSTNSGLALQDWLGDREMNELNFTYGALVQNVQAKTNEWSLGDHRGDKQKYFKRDRVRLLTRDELAFIDNVKALHRKAQETPSGNAEDSSPTEHGHTLDLCSHGGFKVDLVESSKHGGSVLVIESQSHSRLEEYKLSCCSAQDLESWYHFLQKASSLSKLSKPQHTRPLNSLTSRSKLARCTVS